MTCYYPETDTFPVDRVLRLLTDAVAVPDETVNVPYDIGGHRLE